MGRDCGKPHVAVQHDCAYLQRRGSVLLPDHGLMSWKDVAMYLDELSREAKLIVQGRQEFVAEFERFLVRCKAWLFG